jgi:hypothetical protein
MKDNPVPKFNIGDIVKIDFGIDWYSGYILSFETYQNDRIVYVVRLFYDNDVMQDISEEYLTLLEDHHVVRQEAR